MRVSEKIKTVCYAIATLGSLGEWALGGVFASALAIPLLFLYRSVYWLSGTIFYWLVVSSIALSALIMQVALQRTEATVRSPIVLDKIIGVMIALIGIQLRWRVVIFGFILFHFLNTLKPFWWYRSVIDRIERIPGVMGLVGSDLLSGALVNVFLHLITWVMLG